MRGRGGCEALLRRCRVDPVSHDPPEVLRVGQDAWVHIDDLRRVINRRKNRSEKSGAYGVAVGLRWVIEFLDELKENPHGSA